MTQAANLSSLLSGTTLSIDSANVASLSYTGTLTGGTGIVNIGSGQIYKDASGNVGIGTNSPARGLSIYKAGATSRVIIQSDVSGQSIGNGFDIFLDQSNNAGLWNYPSANLLFATSNTERMRIDSSGNVGIGTSSPRNTLSINLIAGISGVDGAGASVPSVSHYSASTLRLGLRGTVMTSDASSLTSVGTYLSDNVFLRGLSGNPGYIVTGVASQIYLGGGEIVFKRASSGTSNTDIIFSESLRIDSSGNVGIGTNSPSTYGKFVVYNSATTGRYFSVSSIGVPYARYDDNSATAGYRIYNLGITGTDQGGVVQANFSADGTNTYNAGQIRFGNSGLYTATLSTQNSYLAFYTATNGSDTEKMRIDSSGNVGIGTNSPSTKLTVAGTPTFRYTYYTSLTASYATVFNMNSISMANAMGSAVLYVSGRENGVPGYNRSFKQYSIVNTNSGWVMAGPFNAVTYGNGHGNPDVQILTTGEVQVRNSLGSAIGDCWMTVMIVNG